MRLHLPPVLGTERELHGQTLRRMACPARWIEGRAARFTHGALRGTLFIPDNADGAPDILLVRRGHAHYAERTHVVRAEIDPTHETVDLADASWLAHPAMTAPTPSIEHVLDSWDDAFRYRLEDRATGRLGLRPPQLGAVHAVLAHWSVSAEVATVVMPTGTGKTDTMAAILVAARRGRTLVVVPSDALRTQLAEKFLTLGVLTSAPGALIAERALCPTVALLKRRPASVEALDEVLDAAHVVVTTSQLATRLSSPLQRRLAERCSTLFVDEAHHVEAATWRALRHAFAARHVLQLTATPFREDGQPIAGKIVFRYRLRQAYDDGYFKPIRFVPVAEYVPARADAAIAERALAELRATLDRGHVLMARVSSVARAREIFELYRHEHDLHPVQLHTGLGVRERRRAREQILSGLSRIIVCVDMLGEGFDLPQLKIAAFHDIRKSLPVTLQLIGRFTRTGPGLGEAVAIANTADIDVRGELQRLYGRDADWNLLLPEIADGVIDERLSLETFLDGFAEELESDVPLDRLRPAASAVVYRTTCTHWTPENFLRGLHAIARRERLRHAIHPEKHTLVIVSATRAAVPWAEGSEIGDWCWELLIAVWLPEKALLFIHSSSLGGNYRPLARALAGDTARLVRDQEVFRAFAGVRRLRLQNVGLKEQFGRNVRYTGRMGADAGPVITELDRAKASKAVLAGTGFEAGAKVTLGASVKGRLWSMRRPTLDQFVAWCEALGTKLNDPSLDAEDALAGTLKSTYTATRPAKIPIAVDWPDSVYAEPENNWWFTIGDTLVGLREVELRPVAFEARGELDIDVLWPEGTARLRLVLGGTEEEPTFAFQALEDSGVRIRRRSGALSDTLCAFFDENPPTIWFADGSSLEGNQYVELRDVGPTFSPERIEPWSWKGVDLAKESQRPERRPDSIQFRVIEHLVGSGNYRAIVDDDGSGEAADIVAVRIIEQEGRPARVEIEFYHCKYAIDGTVGARVGDLYEVCGQTQKSVIWAATPEKKRELFAHLLHRHALRLERTGSTRIEVGNESVLEELREMASTLPVMIRMFVVQPGLSRERASREQLELLGTTETYLTETYQIPLRVIGSN